MTGALTKSERAGLAGLDELAACDTVTASHRGTDSGRVDMDVLWRLVRAGYAARVDVDGYWRYQITAAGSRARRTALRREVAA